MKKLYCKLLGKRENEEVFINKNDIEIGDYIFKIPISEYPLRVVRIEECDDIKESQSNVFHLKKIIGNNGVTGIFKIVEENKSTINIIEKNDIDIEPNLWYQMIKYSAIILVRSGNSIYSTEIYFDTENNCYNFRLNKILPKEIIDKYNMMGYKNVILKTKVI